jgi:N-methylhydantoinase A/acetophenone carboxylase
MGYTIDIDTGGTFTDGFFVKGEEAKTVKVPTTPHDLTVCFIECIKSGARAFGVAVEDLLYETEIIRFSNTIGTNTIIQRDGSKVGLLVTKSREHLAPTSADEGKSPLVLPDMVLGIEEGVSAAGQLLRSPDAGQALGVAQELIDRGARCLVVAFGNSETNPVNERLLRQVIKQEYPRDFLGSVPVFLSSDISLRSGEVERINAAVLNAYIHGKLVRLLYKAGEELRQRLYRNNLFIVHNNGAVARVAKTRAINTYNSGPVAGLLGARLIGTLYGIDDLISADMGGTSFDIGYVRQGQVRFTLRPDVEGFAVNVPMLAINALGAGGGSIASIKDDALQVGPQSAGALPGPVCFDLGGTEPTVTDADLILGVLDPEYFLGGTMKINREKALKAMEQKIAVPLGLAVEEAALRVKQTIDAAMGDGIKQLRGKVWGNEEPLLVVYGGAGPMHCCDLARIAGLKKIIITPFSAVFSAFSSSHMDVGHLYYRRVNLPLGIGVDGNVLTPAVAAMKHEAERDMRGEGFAAEQAVFGLDLFIQSADGSQEVNVTADLNFFEDPLGITRVLEQARGHLAAGGKGCSGDLLLTTVSLTVQAPVPHFTFSEVARATEPAECARKGSRRVYLGSSTGKVEVPVYERVRLMNGHALKGPAIVESETTTLLVPPQWSLKIDKLNNAFLEEVL